MAGKRKALSRGLDALLGPAAEEQSQDPSGGESLASIALDLLQRGKYQPRVDMRPQTLENLAESIRSQGVVQPIVVRPLDAGGGEQRYEIIAGERRWRAAQMAGLQSIPAVVRDVPDESAVAIALIENIQRENLNPLEEAQALERLTEEFSLTHEQAARAVGRSRAAVSNLLRLLDLSDEVKHLVEARELEMGHARALLSLTDAKRQAEAALTVIKRNMSVRETERLVKSLLKGPRKPKKTGAVDPDIRQLESDLTDKLGAKVNVQHGTKGGGKLVISYNDLDELDGILAHIR